MRVTTIGLVVLLSAALVAQDGAQRLTPDEMGAPEAAGGAGTSSVAAVQTRLLKGDATQAGLYTLLVRVAPNTRIEAHAHPDDRITTVVSGIWYFGYGDEFDEAGLKALPAGSFYTEPPNANHFAVTRDEPVVIQITGYGPSGTEYVDPANDPARR